MSFAVYLNISTHRSVEQILGRILRLPNAKKKLRPALNSAYAFAASGNFVQTAKSLRDALVEGAGFQRLEANDLVVPEDPQRFLWDSDPLFVSASEPVTFEPNLSQLSSELRERVTYDGKREDSMSKESCQSRIKRTYSLVSPMKRTKRP